MNEKKAKRRTEKQENTQIGNTISNCENKRWAKTERNIFYFSKFSVQCCIVDLGESRKPGYTRE